MPNIPGLLVCPVERNEPFLNLQTFTGKIIVPESHRFGNCDHLSEFSELSDPYVADEYGVLYKCRELKSNKTFALKMFNLPQDEGIPSSVLREINILKTLRSHPNIINSYRTVAGLELNRNYLVMDYCVISLKELFERSVEAIFDRAMVKFFMHHILLGLEYIHEGLIIHRDICPKNIMFTKEGVLKIGGFCASRFFNKGSMTPGITELNYRAPELLMDSSMYGPAIDMWSVGCIFAELLLKRPLFKGESEVELLKSIFHVLGLPTETIWPGFTELFSALGIERGGLNILGEKTVGDLPTIFAKETMACQDLIQVLLLYFPVARCGAPECLASPYFEEEPQGAKSEDLVKVLRSFMPALESSEMEM